MVTEVIEEGYDVVVPPDFIVPGGRGAVSESRALNSQARTSQGATQMTVGAGSLLPKLTGDSGTQHQT